MKRGILMYRQIQKIHYIRYKKCNIKALFLCVGICILFGTCLLSQMKIASAAEVKKPIIMIDPGHGGIDGGTQNHDGSVFEKELNLDFGLKLAKQIRKNGSKVEMTRETDEDVTKYAPPTLNIGRYRRDLYGRVAVTKLKQSSLLISLRDSHVG